MCADNVKTDQEIRELALQEWYGVLRQLWIAIGKDVEEERFRIYSRDLGDIPSGLLESAFRRLRSERVYSNIPQVGEIQRAVKEELMAANCYGIPEWCDRQWSELVTRHEFGIPNEDTQSEAVM